MAGYIREAEADLRELIDWSWFASLVKLYNGTKTPSNWREAVKGLDVLKVNEDGKLDEHGDPLHVHGPYGLIWILDKKQAHWEKSGFLESMGLDASYMDAALMIYAYTLQKPNVFRPINEIFSTDKREDTESEQVKASMIYTKMLDVACQRLPAKFLYKGVPGSSGGALYRGVKIVYPDFEQRYAKGMEIMFYSFKSVTDKRALMEADTFCGHKGARTIYIIHDAADLVKYIMDFSEYKDDERELLLLPLVRLEVIESKKQCCGKDSAGDPWETADIVHLKLLPDDIVRSPDLAAAIAAAHTKPDVPSSWSDLGYYGGDLSW